MLSISPLMHLAHLCVLHFPFLFAVFFFFMAQFPFQRTISANWWTVGSRVRSNQSKTLFFLHIDNPSFFKKNKNKNTDSFSPLFVSYMDSQLQSQEENPCSKSCESIVCFFSWASVFLFSLSHWNTLEITITILFKVILATLSSMLTQSHKHTSQM